MSDEKQAVEKIEKKEIIIKDLKLPKEITVKVMPTCVRITNTNGNKWYLKGRTLEITTAIPELENRIEKFSKAVIEKCHLGHVTCCIRNIQDTADLQDILSHFTHSAGIQKTTKIEKKTTKKTKKSAKSTKSAEPSTPAPEIILAVQDSLPVAA